MGRLAFERRAWREAFSQLAGVDSLAQEDVERLAVAAHLVGERRASEVAWERAHRVAAGHGDGERAARCAFWLGFDLLLRGEEARASGWLARAERLALENPGGPASGLILLPRFLDVLGRGDALHALDLASQMRGRGSDTGDANLAAFGLLCEGEALIASGRVVEGMRCLDEAMVSVVAGELSPIPTGIIYCAVVAACMEARDLRRAAAWTEALSAWCDSDPSLVPYRGQCLVHRSQVLMARGSWAEARVEAERARAHLAEPEHPALGEALYLQGELHRVCGELDDAETAYRAASRHGREPVPGLALLRLAQGRHGTAASAARRMLQETSADRQRPVVLAAVVEILVATGALSDAAEACDELDRVAGAAGTELLSATALTARASLLLARGQPSDAANALRAALGRWRRLDMPFENARARMLMSEACSALGDRDGAELEREAALAAFETLGACTTPAHGRAKAGGSPLTVREREVIRLVAVGRTNRQIAAELRISEHTVARHVQNIFVKLGLSSRAAATAYAYEHGVL